MGIEKKITTRTLWSSAFFENSTVEGDDFEK